MKSFLRLVQYARPYWFRLAAAMVLGLGAAATTGACLGIIRFVLAKTSGVHDLPGTQVLGIALLIPLLYLFNGFCDFVNGYCVNWVGQRVIADLRDRLFEKLQMLSLDFHSRADVGQTISRVINDPTVIEKTVSSAIVDLTKEPFMLVTAIGIMGYLNWQLTIFTIVLFPICLIPITLFGRRVRKASRRQQLEAADLVRVLHETLTGIRIVKAFSMEPSEIQRFQRVNRAFFNSRMKIVRSSIILNPIIMFVASCGIALAFFYAYQTNMPSADFITFMLATFSMYAPAKNLSRVWSTIQLCQAPADRMFEILDQNPSVVEALEARVLPRLQEKISFDQVQFGYNSKTILDGVTLEVRVGEFIALVGPSGAGKTSLVNLLARFYDPTAGVVKFDGQDLRNVTLSSLRHQIGIVSQETILFHDTIANNIAYGKPDATRDEIITAARRAQAHDFIAEKPEGYETVVGEKGIQLSGGQRQRIAIARAILKNPPILILDEATSALDTEQERAVQAALDDLMQGRTVFAIAHRLSTVQHATRILVLENGKIVETGKHADLLARGGLYKKLYDLQFNL